MLKTNSYNILSLVEHTVDFAGSSNFNMYDPKNLKQILESEKLLTFVLAYCGVLVFIEDGCYMVTNSYENSGGERCHMNKFLFGGANSTKYVDYHTAKLYAFYFLFESNIRKVFRYKKPKLNYNGNILPKNKIIDAILESN